MDSRKLALLCRELADNKKAEDLVGRKYLAALHSCMRESMPKPPPAVEEQRVSEMIAAREQAGQEQVRSRD